MNIIDHGNWVAYVPNPWPEGIPRNVMFCRRVSDGADWYKYQKQLTNNSVFCVVFDNVIQPVYRDPSMLFPQDGLVIEILDSDTIEVIAAYAFKVYDPETNTLV